MNAKINKVFSVVENMVEDWESSEIDRLISELECLSADRYEKEEEEASDPDPDGANKMWNER